MNENNQVFITYCKNGNVKEEKLKYDNYYIILMCFS